MYIHALDASNISSLLLDCVSFSWKCQFHCKAPNSVFANNEIMHGKRTCTHTLARTISGKKAKLEKLTYYLGLCGVEIPLPSQTAATVSGSQRESVQHWIDQPLGRYRINNTGELWRYFSSAQNPPPRFTVVHLINYLRVRKGCNRALAGWHRGDSRWRQNVYSCRLKLCLLDCWIECCQSGRIVLLPRSVSFENCIFKMKIRYLLLKLWQIHLRCEWGQQTLF